MGLSSPGRVLSLESDRVGIVDVNGTRRRIRLALVTAGGTRIAVGDWLLVQLDLAVAYLTPNEATEVAGLLAAIAATRPRAQAA